MAGGAAQMFYTGARVTKDIDAEFSHPIIFSDDLEIAYRDAHGASSVLYLDRQYNESSGLIHDDAHEDSVPLHVNRINPAVLEVRLFSPLDLAVSKIARYADHDQADIASLAACGLIDADEVWQRAEEAAINYIGNLRRLTASIKLACELVREHQTKVTSKKGTR